MFFLFFFLLMFTYLWMKISLYKKRNYLVTGNKATIDYTQSRRFSFQSKTYFLWNVKLRWNYIMYEILLWFQSKVNSSKYVYIDLRTSYESESQDNCPREKLPPHPKINPKPNPTPNRGGGNFSRGQLSGCPPTLKLNLTLTQTPTLTEGNFPRGAIVQIPWKTYVESKNKKYMTKHKKVTLFILSNKLLYLIYLGFPWIWKFRKHQRWQNCSCLIFEQISFWKKSSYRKNYWDFSIGWSAMTASVAN